MLVAHLSDLHLKNDEGRRLRFVRALGQAKAAGAQELIITGDLTASGRERQFQELADVLAEHWPYGRTIVPGNHDSGHGFGRVFGPLDHPKMVGETLVIPIDTRAPRRAILFGALGKIGAMQLSMLDTLTRNVAGPVIIAAHHGPQFGGVLHPFHGLIDRAAVMRLLGRSPNIHYLAGHDHRVLDIGQVHTAGSVATHDDPLRLYEVGAGGFRSIYRSADPGSAGFAGPPSSPRG